ncbi:sugar transporter SWEET1 [Lycorma delicatula]|uniref:sugar transporter SWEET1 n=1 Tax=Lycorma delicatula TaxID=130591 RepID=UPI003F5101DD
MVLEEYKEIVASVAGITTIAQFFSPVFICKDIVQKGSTKDIDPMPFIGGMVMSVLMLQHGLILNDPAMIPVNIFGFVLNFIYFLVYYSYSNERDSLHGKVSKGVALVAVLLGYVRWEYEENVEFRFGIIVTMLMLALVGAPLLHLGEIIKTKSTAGLPFPLILSGTVVTFLWLLYGIIIKNIFIQVQNVVAFTLCATQLALFAIYPSKSKDDEKNAKKKKL